MPVRCLPATPLLAVDRAEITIFIGPFIPDRDVIFLQIPNIRIAADEPQKLVNDGPRMKLLCRQQRKPRPKVKAHLMPEHGPCASAGAIAAVNTFFEYAGQEIKILLHGGRSEQG